MSHLSDYTRRSGNVITVDLFGRRRAERHARELAANCTRPGEALTLDRRDGQTFTYRVTPDHREPSSVELAAVTAIFAAYMACNAAGDPLHWEVTPGHSVLPTAMGYLATAGRRAWRELGLPESLWDDMVSSGSDATHVYRCWTGDV